MLREAGVRAPILVFGALSVSDLDGIFAHDLTPTISTPRRGARAAGRRRAARRPAALPPEDRHRHEPSRLPARQPRRTLPRGRRVAATSRSPRSTPTSPPPTTPTTRRSRCSASVSRRRSRCCRRSGSRPRCATPPTARRCCATSASGTTSSVRACCSTASCRRRWRDAAAATCPVTPQPYRGGEGHAARAKAPATAFARVVDGPATLAVVPAGYADGLDLRLAGRGYMLVRGRRAPIVGSVCMDMTMIDVTGMDVAPGDEVVIVGEQGERVDRRARDRRGDRDDSVRVAVPRRIAD